MDDHRNDRSTTSWVIVQGGPTHGVLETQSDVDWFRVSLSKFRTYKLRAYSDNSTLDSFVGIDFYPAISNQVLLSIAPYFFPNGYRFSPAESGNQFIEVSYRQPGWTSPAKQNVRYSLELEIVDEEVFNLNGYWLADWQNQIYGMINSAGDQDFARVQLFAGVTYQLDLLGVASGGEMTLGDPYLALYRIDSQNQSRTLVAEDDNSGFGSNSRIRYTPAVSGIYEMVVSGVNGSLGNWALSPLGNDDFGATPAAAQSTAPLVFRDTQTSVIGTAEIWGYVNRHGGDVDLRRIRLESGNNYSFALPVGARGEIALARANGQWFRYAAAPANTEAPPARFEYFASSNEELYLVHRAGDGAINSSLPLTANYEILVERLNRPRLLGDRNIEPILSISPDASFDLESYFTDLAPNTFIEVFANVALRLDRDNAPDLSLAPGLVHSHPLAGNRLYLTPFEGSGEVFVRVAVPLNDGSKYWSNWASIGVHGQAFPVEHSVQNAGFVKPTPQPLTFAFADELPSYYAGDQRVNGFTALNQSERSAIRSAIQAWRDASQRPFLEVTGVFNPATVDMVIFKSSLNVSKIGFYPGSQIGGDLILNRDDQLYEDLSPGKRGYFELLRGIGSSLGLSHVAALNREQTIMGQVVDPSLNSDVFPTSPLPYDQLRLESVYRGSEPTNLGDNIYSLQGTPFVKTIFDTGGYDTISAAGQTVAVTIDLRPKMVSYTGRDFNAVRRNTFYTGFQSQIERAIGGRGSDWISGSDLHNRLVGGLGNDVLIGRQGNDRTFGDGGNDTYIYRFGDGHDQIDDRGLAADRDNLRIEGFSNFQNLENDLAFQRIGSELVIDINPGTDAAGSVATIRLNMLDRAAGVETLNLVNANQVFLSVNLRSIFEQANSDFQRFRATDVASDFGVLAAPLFTS
jgi:hypothetical protein